MSKFTSLALGAAALAGASMPLSALTLATRGLGQVLEFPYYTVNANQGTLVTLINSTTNGKAVKARFREALNGRVVAQFNVYLSPFDVWVAQVFDAAGTVAIGTLDNSCTVPAFSASATTAHVPALAFSTQNFTGANSDTGPTDATRLTEGHFEFFEMGEIVAPTATYIDTTHVNGVPPGCAQLVAAWADGGAFTTNPSADLTPPAGGLFGSEAIVDVTNGTFFSVMPAVLDGFSTTVQHTSPASAAPDFDTASAGSDGKFAVSVDAGGQLLDLHYASAVDAVSALFMANQELNEYEVTASLGAQSDWVSTFPTKHFYVDPLYRNSSAALPPFEEKFGEFADDAGSCIGFDNTVYDRESAIVVQSGCHTSPCPPTPMLRGFCAEANVVTLSAITNTALHSSQGISFGPPLVAGHMNFDFASIDMGHALPASAEGTTLRGMPVLGFVAENFVNANATPGVLANYTFAIPHRATVLCATSTGACP
jgi:hypothetical protein